MSAFSRSRRGPHSRVCQQSGRSEGDQAFSAPSPERGPQALRELRSSQVANCASLISPAASARVRMAASASEALRRLPFKFEKHRRGREPAALVAVEKWMVPHDAERIARGQFAKRGGGLVRVKVHRLGQRRFQQTGVADSRRAAELGEQAFVDREHHFEKKPLGLLHLASSLRVLR